MGCLVKALRVVLFSMLSIVAVANLIGAVVQAYDAVQKTGWKQTSGVVVANDRGFSFGFASSAGTLAVEYLDFRLPEDVSPFGVNASHPTHLGGFRDDLEVGDTVVVYYDADDPSDSTLEPPLARWIRVTALTITAVVFYMLARAFGRRYLDGDQSHLADDPRP